MKNGEYRIYLSIISLIIVLAILLGAYKINEKYFIVGEIENNLAAMSTVKTTSIEKKDGKYEIEMKMEKLDNIQKVYNEIDMLVTEKLKAEDYHLKIKNRPCQKLEDFYYHLQPAIYEALANKQFLWLDQEIAEKSSAAGISSKYFIDNNHIFIQFADGEDYFYQIIDRVPETLE